MKHISDIKEKNKRNILKLLYAKKVLSKKRIAISLSLSPSVITKLCNELLNEGIIEETSSIQSRKAGRREIGLSICPTYKYCFGVIINHKYTSIIMTDMKLNISDKISFPTKNNPQEHLLLIINSLNKLITSYSLENKDILGIGISLKGITDGIYSYVGIWSHKVNIKSFFEEHLSIPVVIDNGIRCSAILKQLFTSNSNFLFIKYIEAGIGGAIIKDGKVLRGETNSIMDLGHMILDPTGEYCPICKRKGCLESLISIENTIKYIKSHFSLETTPILWDICKGNSNKITVDIIIQAVEKGSIFLNNIFKNNATYMAIALINTLAIIDVKKIILMGDFFSSERFCQYFRSAIYEYQLTPLYENIEIQPNKNNLLAPIALVLNEFIF